MAELFEAIKSGDGATVDRLLERDRALVDARDETGLSPVLVALYRGKGEIAASILRRRDRADAAGARRGSERSEPVRRDTAPHRRIHGRPRGRGAPARARR